MTEPVYSGVPGYQAPATGVFPQRPVDAHAKVGSVTPLSKPWAAIYASAAVIIMLFALFILYFLNVQANAQIKSHEEAIVALNQELTSEPLLSTAKTAAILNQAIGGYTRALGNQSDYALFNSEITKVTPKNIRIATLSVDDKGTVRIAATANDFVSAGKALLAYRQTPIFTQVTLPTVSLTEKDGNRLVSFTIAATLNKSRLKSTQAQTPASNTSNPVDNF